MDITPKGYTIRLNANEAEEVNTFLEDNNVDSSNFKELFFAILQKANNPVTEVNEVLPTDLVAVAKDTLQIDATAEATDSFITAQIIDALLHPTTVEVVKEVTQELPENNYLIEVSPKEVTVLNEISKNRAEYAKKYRIEHQEENFIELIKKMSLNKGAIYNRSGDFYTGKR